MIGRLDVSVFVVISAVRIVFFISNQIKSNSYRRSEKSVSTC